MRLIEVEQRYAGVDFADLERRLASWDVRSWEAHEEIDHYFNAPDRDLVETGESFRLRRIDTGNWLTYKAKRVDPGMRIRPELEIALRDGEQAAQEMIQLLECLKYRFMAVVRKKRKTARFERRG